MRWITQRFLTGQSATNPRHTAVPTGTARVLGRCMKSEGSPAKSGMVGNPSRARCLGFVCAKFHYRALVFIVGVVMY